MLLVADVRERAAHRRPRRRAATSTLDRVGQRAALGHPGGHPRRLLGAHPDGATREHNPRYHALLTAFERADRLRGAVNTSFNVRGEPIVCTPEDAYRCFMRTEMDYLVLGPFLLAKARAAALAGDRGLAQGLQAGLILRGRGMMHGKVGYAAKLLREIVRFALANKVYWLVPLILVLVIALLVVTSQGARR